MRGSFPGRHFPKSLALVVLSALFLAMMPLETLEARLTVNELFLLLPDSECGGYSKDERQAMLEDAFAAPGDSGRTIKRDPQKPWVDQLSDNLLVLHWPTYGYVTYKSFDGADFQLLAACRGRQWSSPMDTACLLNLCLLRHDSKGIYRVDLKDYLPRISILDFVRADTMLDPKAVQDIAARAPNYAQCLSCKASVHERLGLDIVTSTAVNAAACGDFLPSFGLLPLSWNGSMFTKPYDRADKPRTK